MLVLKNVVGSRYKQLILNLAKTAGLNFSILEPMASHCILISNAYTAGLFNPGLDPRGIMNLSVRGREWIFLYIAAIRLLYSSFRQGPLGYTAGIRKLFRQGAA